MLTESKRRHPNGKICSVFLPSINTEFLTGQATGDRGRAWQRDGIKSACMVSRIWSRPPRCPGQRATTDTLTAAVRQPSLGYLATLSELVHLDSVRSWVCRRRRSDRSRSIGIKWQLVTSSPTKLPILRGGHCTGRVDKALPTHRRYRQHVGRSRQTMGALQPHSGARWWVFPSCPLCIHC